MVLVSKLVAGVLFTVVSALALTFAIGLPLNFVL